MQTWYQERREDGTVPAVLIRNGIAAAPDDLDILEFAIKWRVNPRELREQWELRDIYWLQLVEEAQRLAAPVVEQRARERAAKKAKRK
ncbi:MAG: hypothetical protein JNK38_01220 [Acidobacteria bacterium]|nr:hypothetical protein [Acidobacteriota bacterium]